MRDLGLVGDFNAAKAMMPTHLEARAETLMGAEHAPAQVFAIAETAERRCLQFAVPYLPRQIQALAVFA